MTLYYFFNYMTTSLTPRGSKTYEMTYSGIAGVANTGDDSNWTGHDLAGVNYYGFGRLLWDLSLSSEEIGQEWISLYFTPDEEVVDHVLKILMMSWTAYEKYTSPLGIGWMVNPNHHYGPNVDGYEYDRWGTYHKADHEAIGFDRTSQGSAYTNQYFEENRRIFENRETCPEELLLFFHRIPYKYVLKSGKTLIQHIYDSHFDGVSDVKAMVEHMEAIEAKIDKDKYKRIMDRFSHQVEHAKEWRDVVNSYFYRKTLIEDKKKRRIY